ncbi:GNAT family N-acetyltransferase [Bacillus sp. CMF21]|uniref:GNAT family N-acetyltransferase n=1 Tax=Metabacillus dongyingensis TaxID=2874282 RepID=UPI001CBBE1F8|nr:GNAT family protein [Metabacillus dongyingensis]UAL53427.1 GNAT family N-acetyltransferase [Metabacillus dongyingensis]UOK58920.1 GNAT family N-acetyltransferase [Bacillus sp. OVS6]USK29750.1 GNAT family N-acetyltransferase [Bacillus sp. CMF21]
MQLLIKKMNRRMAAEILQWNYKPPYDFYNMELTEGNINGMLSNSYYAVVDLNSRLIGFFCLGKPAQVPNGPLPEIYSENMIDIGLGLEPDRTGRGMGHLFFSFILHHVHMGFPNMPLRLTVASFNKRAIRLYKSAGFIEKASFDTGHSAFLVMVKK